MGGDFLSFSEVTEAYSLDGAHFTSPLKTVDFLEAYPGILGQKFTGSSKADWLDSAGTQFSPPLPGAYPQGWGLKRIGWGDRSQGWLLFWLAVFPWFCCRTLILGRSMGRPPVLWPMT